MLAHVTVAVGGTTAALFFDFVFGRLCRMRLQVLRTATVFFPAVAILEILDSFFFFDLPKTQTRLERGAH